MTGNENRIIELQISWHDLLGLYLSTSTVEAGLLRGYLLANNYDLKTIIGKRICFISVVGIDPQFLCEKFVSTEALMGLVHNFENDGKFYELGKLKGILQID